MTKSKSPQIGGFFDDWLKSEGIYEQVTDRAVKEVFAWENNSSMKDPNVANLGMTDRLDTSGVPLDRSIDPTKMN